ncbi:Oligosaccharide translocation protein rft1 [Neophaeococcomyces mojaviensis]|uniref:Oligosaccharide translocation protein rft1 n=1 Tax=Neophaeococcomyces mojaviensis TaxID=3383035 RepID=A0ACC3A1Y6_9EURO|nr:Oligosaccharide translocation protein rft1 [Knufia sp. JES_112]
MGGTATSKSASSTVYLIMIQVVSRGLTFFGNQALLRYLSPDHLGLAIQLEALSVSVLYTARESLRVALQRSGQGQADDADKQSLRRKTQASVNAAYLVVLLGLLLGTLWGSWYLYQVNEEVLASQDFALAFRLYGVATIAELASEPGFVIIQQHALFRDRARAETSAAIARCIAACLAAFYMHRTGMAMSVLPFAFGQLCYALSLLFVYFWTASKTATSEGFSIVPAKVPSSEMLMSMFSKPLLALAAAFYGQSIFKWLLTQGDTLVLSLFADLQSQGIFALASNYGGLASRLLFQPVEESSRNIFGALLSESPSTQKPPKATNTTQPTRGSQAQLKRQHSLTYLSTTLHAYLLLVAIPCTTLLPHIFPLVIQTLLGSGSQWSSSQTYSLLYAYSYYIPCLAVNGILDAFVTSVATEAELGVQSFIMLAVTIIYLGAAYIGITVLQLGAVGLVYSNCLNMVLRIAFSLWFMRKWTQRNLTEDDRTTDSTFMRFCKSSTPSTSCISTAAIVAIGLQVKGQVKQSMSGTAAVAELSKIKIGPVDLFELSYLFSAAVVLVSSVVLTEHDFLLGSIEPLLPRRVKNMLAPYIRTQAAQTGSK